MSYRLVELVIDYGPRGPTEFAVLVALARRAHNDGTEARPGLDQLTRDARMGSKRATSRALTQLRRGGWVELERHASGGAKGTEGQPTSWRLVVERLTETDATSGVRPESHTPLATETHATSDRDTRHLEGETHATATHKESVLRIKDESVLRSARGELVASNAKVPAKRSNRPSVAASVEPPGFRDFWTVYPRHVARGEAVRSFGRAVQRDGSAVIATGVASWATYWRAEGTEQRFIPHPTTFLNQARYLDQPPMPKSSEPKGWAGIRDWLEGDR
jgi:hypothetical protein